MYVIYHSKGFQDVPRSYFMHEAEAREALERFCQNGKYFLREEDDDSYAVQKLRADLLKRTL